MSDGHDPAQAIGRVDHYFGNLSVAAISISAPLEVGNRVHIVGHTTDLVQEVRSMQIDHASVEGAKPGDDVAIGVDDHVREGDLIFREPA
jgi:translation elongation factor EF-1alpha